MYALQDLKDVHIFFLSHQAFGNESRTAGQKRDTHGPDGSIAWQKTSGLADTEAFRCLSKEPPSYLDDHRLHNVLGMIKHVVAGIGPSTRNFLREGQGPIKYVTSFMCFCWL